VLYGSSASGLARPGNQFWHQDVSSIPDAAEPGDNLGDALAGGDFNGDGRADLAIGIPGEEVNNMSSAGAVQVLYGSSASGLARPGNQFWHQDVSSIPDAAEENDNLGTALASDSSAGHFFN
jgi:FG-GAP repeat